MSKPESWQQEGPLGDAFWFVGLNDFGDGLRIDAMIQDNYGSDATGTVRLTGAQHLRDFARALDRAAAALEAASLDKPNPWPPEGWKIGNPDWPSGKGPHLVPED